MSPFTTTCPGCGATVPDEAGPTHQYVPSAPGCWAALGKVQADEMTRFGYPPAHKLVVDCYMAQHPGPGTDRRDRQSVIVHLVALYAHIELGMNTRKTMTLMQALTKNRPELPLLAPRRTPGKLTVLDMRDSTDLADYTAKAEAWARSVWDSWSHEQPRIRALFADAADGKLN